MTGFELVTERVCCPSCTATRCARRRHITTSHHVVSRNDTAVLVCPPIAALAHGPLRPFI